MVKRIVHDVRLRVPLHVDEGFECDAERGDLYVG